MVVYYIEGKGVPNIKATKFFNIKGEELNIEYVYSDEGLLVLNLRFVSPGIYSLLLTDNNDKVHGFKIIKL